LERRLREDGYEVVYLDAKTISGVKDADFIRDYYPQGRLRMKLERRARQGRWWAKAGLKVRRYKPLVLLFDEFTRLPDSVLADQIEGLFNQRLIHAFVCAQQRPDLTRTSQSFLDRIQNRRMETGRLSRAECLCILTHRFGEKGILSEATLNTLTTECGCLPRRILESVERVYQHLYDSGELREAVAQSRLITIGDGKMAEFVRQGLVETPPEGLSAALGDEPLRPIPGITLSILQHRLVLSLYRSPKTIKALSEELRHGEGTINTALLRLRKRGLVTVERNIRPKVFGLEGGFRNRIPAD
jgi:hypothetical protein